MRTFIKSLIVSLSISLVAVLSLIISNPIDTGIVLNIIFAGAFMAVYIFILSFLLFSSNSSRVATLIGFGIGIILGISLLYISFKHETYCDNTFYNNRQQYVDCIYFYDFIMLGSMTGGHGENFGILVVIPAFYGLLGSIIGYFVGRKLKSKKST